MFYNLFDSHSHSAHSPDGCASVEALCEAALAVGLSGIAITDHAEMDRLGTSNYILLAEDSIKSSLAAKERYRGRLHVAVGLELGQPWAAVDATRLLLKHSLDFVIGSVHRLTGWPDLNTMDCAWMGESTVDEMMHAYFDQVEELIGLGCFDVLGHLSFPLKCAMRNCGVTIRLDRYTDRTSRILKRLMECGKGIEINTSGLRCALGETMPPLDVLRRYRALGGELVTIGSDAHSPEAVGCGLQPAMELLREAGFEYFAVYKQRKPVMLSLL